jgi:hypothetical protein
VSAEGPVRAAHPRWEGMSGPERIWYERLCRRLGVNPVCGPLLDQAGIRLAHELLRAHTAGTEKDVERLHREVKAAQVRVEDERAAELGLPPRPKP